MDVEFGLKLTKTIDDPSSFKDFQLGKDQAGPVFLSREDVNSFILTVHLRGLKKENIDIKISEDGTRITVHAKKPVQQTVSIGQIVHKKWTDFKEFRKVFKIPDGVFLDRIKAEFKGEGSVLIIIMPKQEKGIRGVGVEEVEEVEVGRATEKSGRELVVAKEFPERDKVGVRIKEENEMPKDKIIEADHVVDKEMDDRWGSEKTKIVEEVRRKDINGERVHWKKPVAEEFPKKEYTGKTQQEEVEQRELEEVKSIEDEVLQGRNKIPQEPQKLVPHTDVTDSTKSKPDQELERAATPQLHYTVEQHGKDEVTEPEKTSNIGDENLEASNERSSQEKESESSEEERQKDLGEGATQKKKRASTRCKLCAPCVVGGSAIVISFIALVIHRAKKRQVKSA